MSSPTYEIDANSKRALKVRPAFMRFQRNLRRIKGMVSDFIYHLFL